MIGAAHSANLGANRFLRSEALNRNLLWFHRF